MSTGWGNSRWGSSQWGVGDSSPTAPVIEPLHPVDGDVGVAQQQALSIRLTDDTRIVLGQTRISVNGLMWVLGGTAVNGAGLTATANAGNGFDLLLTPPAAYANGSVQEVLVLAEDEDGNVTVATYAFMVGVGLRLLQVQNPFENMLLAYFNRPMLLDAAFFTPANWVITPISAGAAPLTITGVTTRDGLADVGHLQYVGGGSTYRLTALGLHGQDGSSLEQGHDSVEFEIAFGDQPVPTVRLFNSIFGPLGISQRVISRRTIDSHVVSRSLAIALDEQFRLRAQRLDGTAGRDGRPGKARGT